eukprot:UN27347
MISMLYLSGLNICLITLSSSLVHQSSSVVRWLSGICDRRITLCSAPPPLYSFFFVRFLFFQPGNEKTYAVSL